MSTLYRWPDTHSIHTCHAGIPLMLWRHHLTCTRQVIIPHIPLPQVLCTSTKIEEERSLIWNLIKKGHQLDQLSVCVSHSIWLVSPVMQGGSPHDRSSVLFLCHENKTEVRPGPQHSHCSHTAASTFTVTSYQAIHIYTSCISLSRKLYQTIYNFFFDLWNSDEITLSW